uniref:Uncharacterized protein n=1 Tax=Rhizophora mucronata TaxID=61149 RepID=A0A2P2QLL2_RHIMU
MGKIETDVTEKP